MGNENAFLIHHEDDYDLELIRTMIS
jgi:hypothetical protein